MLKHIVVLLALVYLSEAEDTIKEILFLLREVREQQHLLTFVSKQYDFLMMAISLVAYATYCGAL